MPVAYSRKFSGFFGNLGYPIVVDLAEADTETAVAQTLTLVKDRERLAELAQPAREVAQQRIRVFADALHEMSRRTFVVDLESRALPALYTGEEPWSSEVH